MVKKSEDISTTLKKEVVVILITAVSTMIGTIWISIQDPLAKFIITNVPKTILLLLPIALFFLLIVAVLYIVYLRNEVNNPLDGYEFDEKIGILRNPKDGLTYCPSCLHKNIKSPLRVQENGWLCLNKDCKEFYANPDYKAPSYRPIYRSGRNWVTDW